ncbi:MAG: tail fiber domain-containing protein [Elusimicrobia bacterium]|nr:tail fiber domain-containing protein [Elusimicrobiota bacterium]
MRLSWLALALAFPAPCRAQTTMTGDAWISGKTGVAVTPFSARFEVQAGSATETAFQVSGVDETPFLLLDKQGRLALSTTPAAELDVWGVADSSDTGVQLQGGALYPASTGYQILFGYAGGASYRHAWRSGHSTSTANSSLDFLLWTPAQPSSAIGAMEALSLVTSTSGVAAHVRPATGTIGVELVVSDGATLGNGTVHAAYQGAHSSRELKTDIEYLDAEEEREAYAQARALRPARYRYKGSRERRLRWGLIFEDAPASIRGPGASLSVNGRVMNLELAGKELLRRIERSEADAKALKERR